MIIIWETTFNAILKLVITKIVNLISNSYIFTTKEKLI